MGRRGFIKRRDNRQWVGVIYHHITTPAHRDPRSASPRRVRLGAGAICKAAALDFLLVVVVGLSFSLGQVLIFHSPQDPLAPGLPLPCCRVLASLACRLPLGKFLPPFFSTWTEERAAGSSNARSGRYSGMGSSGAGSSWRRGSIGGGIDVGVGGHGVGGHGVGWKRTTQALARLTVRSNRWCCRRPVVQRAQRPRCRLRH
jgi:hypothetical protein